VAFLVPALGHHFFVDTVALARPFCAIGGKRTLFGESDAAIQSYPVHDPCVDEMFSPIAHLPNTGIGKVPVLADPFKTIADLYPNVVGGGADCGASSSSAFIMGLIQCFLKVTDYAGFCTCKQKSITFPRCSGGTQCAVFRNFAGM
jgi:hypothetical protein